MGRWLSKIEKSLNTELTKPTKPSSVSFVGTYIGAFSLLEDFFRKASSLSIELLPDDKRWLKTICYGVPLLKLKSLLEQYVTRWLDAIKNEPLSHKQQNTGRFVANTFLRETLRNRTDKTDKTSILNT